MKDPYKYFRVEGKELADGLAKAVLDLEKGERSSPLIAQMLRFAHTLKGAARVVRQPQIADHAHAIEDLLTAHRESDLALPPERIAELLERIDCIEDGLNELMHPVTAPEPRPAMPDEPAATEAYLMHRPEVGDLDQLLQGMAEAHTHLTSLERSRTGFERVRAMIDEASAAVELRKAVQRLEDELAAGAQQVGRELQEARQTAEQMRLVNASTLFNALERASRDVAQAQGKRIVFEGTGGDVRVEAHVLGALREPLMQIVRNAVAHGIETEDLRAAQHKGRDGRVQVMVASRGSSVRISVQDDGAGIDLEAVQRVAVAHGRMPDDAGGLDALALTRLLLLGGLSTSRTVTEVSGRGIGLELVREAVERLGGEIDLRTTAGIGTTFEITVPLSLISIQVLSVESSGTSVTIPLDAIKKVVRIPEHEIVQSAGRETVEVEGRMIPFLVLERALHPEHHIERRSAWTAAVIEADSNRAALAVDRLLGTKTVLVRPLPELVKAATFDVVAGASLDAEGNPVLVLDPDVIVRLSAENTVAARAEERPRSPILIIDDSLTTRMLEQSILESAGYEVELAVSGEDGLEKAHLKKYSLFLVDVEMPGIDGYDFIERTQADPALRATPSILVTSRGSLSDMKRGEQVGARGYIVKTEFDQGVLLERIQRLVG